MSNTETNNNEENTQPEENGQETNSGDPEVQADSGKENDKGNPEEKLGDAGKKALEAERLARKEADKKLAEALKKIEEFEDSQRTDEEKRQRALEKREREAEKLRQEAAQLKRDLLVRDVIDEVGLPKRLAPRLQGDDYESLVEDAKSLKELFGDKEDSKSPRKPSPVPQAGGHGEVKTSNAELFTQAINDAFHK